MRACDDGRPSDLVMWECRPGRHSRTASVMMLMQPTGGPGSRSRRTQRQTLSMPRPASDKPGIVKWVKHKYEGGPKGTTGQCTHQNQLYQQRQTDRGCDRASARKDGYESKPGCALEFVPNPCPPAQGPHALADPARMALKQSAVPLEQHAAPSSPLLGARAGLWWDGRHRPHGRHAPCPACCLVQNWQRPRPARHAPSRAGAAGALTHVRAAHGSGGPSGAWQPWMSITSCTLQPGMPPTVGRLTSASTPRR